MSEVHRFKSHIDGKNADVVIYADRIEWALEARTGMSTGRKVALGAVTGGLSLLATGVSGKQKGSEVIPLKSISSVTTKKDGLRFTNVSVICTGNTIDFRVGHGEAPQIRDTITALLLGSHPAQLAPVLPPLPPAATLPPPPPSAAAPAPALPPAAAVEPSLADKLRELGELRDAGVLDETEFAAAKAKLLA